MSDFSEAIDEREAKGELKHLRSILSFVLPYKKAIFGACVSLVFAAGTVLAIGFAMRGLVDQGFSNRDAENINYFFGIIIVVVAMMAVSTFGRFYLVSWLGERVVADIRKKVYDHIIELSPAFFEVTRPGEILSRLTVDTTLIQTVVGSTASVAARNVLLFIGGLGAMIYANPKLSAYVLFLIPAVGVPLITLGRRVRVLSRESQDKIAELSAQADESISAVRTVQAFNREKEESRNFGGASESAFNVAISRVTARAWLTAIVMFFVFGAVVGILWAGAIDVLSGAMTPGDMGLFIFSAIMVAGAFGSLSEVFGDLQRAAGASERIIELLAERPDIRVPDNPVPLPSKAKGEISFRDLTFHYPSRPDRAALIGINLEVAEGETVALVGPSGAGKSTIFQLLLRFYEPHSGTITLDGVDITKADPKEVRARMGLVPQDTVIFATSALENIRFGRPNASDEEVWNAAQAAQAADFIRELPNGLDTFMGEKGVRLSGGQRQRIAIARAILCNPPVLLLDEATSSLDAESERLVQTALDGLMADRTTLVIAHRLATVKRADKIVVFDEGEIVAQGTHEQLTQSGGLYARLASLQFHDAPAPAPSLVRAN